MAEQQTSDQAFSVTLTYAGDTPKAAVLCYKDIQDFLKRFREDGFAVRYIVAGEYGKENGRAHWHIVLFLKGKTLEIVEAGQRENDWQVVLPRFKDDPAARVQFVPWSNKKQGRGFVYFQYPDYGGFRYAMKYALKAQEGDARCLGMSKKPPLGHAFFMQMAEEQVEQRLPVQLPTYAFKGVKNSKGKHIQFCLQGRMREMYLDHYAIQWALTYGGEPPASQWYQEKYLDKIARQVAIAESMALRERKKYTALSQEAGLDPVPKRPDWAIQFDAIKPGWVPEKLWMHNFKHHGNDAHIMVGLSDAFIDLGDGKPEWRIGKAEIGDVQQQLLRTGLKPVALRQVSEWLAFMWSPEFAYHRNPTQFWPQFRNLPISEQKHLLE